MSDNRNDQVGQPPLGVGLLGAGPAVQAIHLPTLARLGDRFAVRHVMDVDEDLAATVAATVGATHSSTMEAVLTDVSVEVVAVCSPARFHAAQVIAAMRAGKSAVLCEKPLAETSADAAEIAAVSAETGVPVIVGAMHMFDPAWVALQPHLGSLRNTAHTITSRIVLPPNSRFEDFASEIAARPEGGPFTIDSPEARAAVIRGILLGLTIHDLPLIRAFLPHPAALHVVAADISEPFEYHVVLSDEVRLVQLIGTVTSLWEPVWSLEVFDDDTHLDVEFTPSYVHAGSAIARLTREQGTTELGPFDMNGYENEWAALALATAGAGDAIPAMHDMVDDLAFALRIADGAAEKILEEAR